MPQECESGVFVTDGWNKTMKRKVQYIVDALQELQEGDVMIHTDSDVVFLSPYKDTILNEMGDADLIFQSDVGTVCMGFFACRVNSKTRQIFSNLLKDFDNHYHDQEGMNYLINNTKHGLKIKLFSHRIFNHGFFGNHYKGEDTVEFPADMVALHANFAIGIDHKIKLIKLALKK
jgi:hypothetical protein